MDKIFTRMRIILSLIISGILFSGGVSKPILYACPPERLAGRRDDVNLNKFNLYCKILKRNVRNAYINKKIR
jgi:hypothetical protein